MGEEKAPYGNIPKWDKMEKIKSDDKSMPHKNIGTNIPKNLNYMRETFESEIKTEGVERLFDTSDRFYIPWLEGKYSELKSVVEKKIKVKMKFKDAPIGARFQFTDSEDTYIKLHSNGDGLIVKWNGTVEGLQSHCCWIDEENDIDFNTVIEVF